MRASLRTLLIVYGVSTLTVLLSGCANLHLDQQGSPTTQPQAVIQQPIIPIEAEHHLASISAINDFKINGRIGVQAQGYGLSGPIKWEHNQDNDEIGIFSPLGNKVAEIVKTSEGVTLTTEGKTLKAQDTGSLTELTLGWRLPFDHLSDWIIGRPAKGLVSQAAWDEKGQLSKLTQDGWEVSYMQYQTESQHALPNKINLRNNKMNVRLVIENWDVSQQNKAETSTTPLP